MSTFDERRTQIGALPYVNAALQVFDGQIAGSLMGAAKIEAYTMGSMRRASYGEPTTIGDVDLMVTTQDKVDGIDMLAIDLPPWMKATPLKAHGWLEQKIGDEVTGRMMVDAWWCPWESRGPFAMFLTGPMSFNVMMRQVTNSRRPDLMLTQYGLFEAVRKPTKANPDRRVTGARVDRYVEADPPRSTEMAERVFWDEWCQAVQWTRPFPPPGTRYEGRR